jgi:two-component system sensor histidine kinase PilS (NtrC family)
VKLLTNPLVVKMIITFFFAALAFLAGALLIRYLRRSLREEAELGEASPAVESGAFEAAAYRGVIQKLKEQERELERLHQIERARAAKNENVSEAVLSNLTSGVVLFDSAGLVRQANPAARGILGYASAFGLHARDLFRGAGPVRSGGPESDDTPETLAAAVEAALRAGRSFRRLEADYVTPASESRVLGVTLSPVRARDGSSLGAACLVSDLTEIAELSRQMRLKENLASLGEMSAGIAHEFKNSLATVSGYAQMLAGEERPEVVRDFAARIARETDSLTRIVTDFLNFARPQKIEPETLDLRALLEEAGRGCNLELELGGLPAGLSLEGDRTALRQAFSNLLRNSAEAASPGTQLRLQVTAEANEPETRVTVRDNGPGIPQENLAHIFIPFFTTKAGGTGLGLALVHRIVSEHGGSIGVASDGSGTTFTLSFPSPSRAKKGSPEG